MSDPIEHMISSMEMKRQAQVLSDMTKMLDSESGSNGLGTENIIAGGVGLLKAGAGIAGLFNKIPELPKYTSSYEQDPNLRAAANIALNDAVSNKDDYAARIRVRNQRIHQMMNAVANSGGDRNFVAANETAARDVENVGNLAIDAQEQDKRMKAMGNASQMQQLALFDRLNESRDKVGATELNLKSELSRTELQNKNTQGAASLISGGMNDIAGAAGNEVAGDAIRNSQKIQIANALAKIYNPAEAKEELDDKKKTLETNSTKTGYWPTFDKIGEEWKKPVAPPFIDKGPIYSNTQSIFDKNWGKF